MTTEHYYDRATTLTVYTKKRVLTRTGKYKNVWTATVCGKEYRATTLKMCRVLVSEALEQLAMGNLTWFVMNPVEA
jgi:hypothetical protein